VLLFVLMFAGLVLSTSIPQAFGARGVWFASAYAAMQVGHTLFWLLSVPRGRAAVRWNAIRILIWLGVSAVFWVWGGMAQNVDRRLVLWAVALVIEYAGPMARFWIPRYGASAVEDWYVEGGNMAERCAAFIIIALGGSLSRCAPRLRSDGECERACVKRRSIVARTSSADSLSTARRIGDDAW